MPDTVAFAALKYELIADPLQRGYAAMTDAEVAASLDTLNITETSSIPIGAVEGYLLLDGTLIRLDDWLAANTTPAPLRTAVAALLRVISSQRLTMFQIETAEQLSSLQAQISVMVSGGLLTQQQANDLLDMAVTTVSRAHQIGWPQGISADDVKKARKR